MAMLPLGTKFKISLRPGTKDAAGKAVPATLRETAETPPFRVKGFQRRRLHRYGQRDCPAALPGLVQRER